MTRRTRFIAGLITSLVLVVSLAEGAWASTCTPAMEMSAASGATSQEMPHGSDCMPGPHDEQDRQGVPDCPFGPAGMAQGCVLAASLPAGSAVGVTPSPEGAELFIAFETEPHLRLGSTVFHPPKA